MYSNVTEDLNRPLCCSMAYAPGFTVAMNEIRAVERLKKIYE
jgi:hypothetical protein